jgi:hypothetical protein
VHLRNCHLAEQSLSNNNACIAQSHVSCREHGFGLLKSVASDRLTKSAL